MYYVPVTDDYWRLPVTYVPVYSPLTSRTLCEDSSSKLNNDLTKVRKELAELREELYDIRTEKEACPLCSSTARSVQCNEDCSICYPRVYTREREEDHSRALSPVHYCEICHDYVIDQEFPPPPPSPRPYKRITKKKKEVDEDKLSEYLFRQLELQRLRQRYVPETRPIWIPTAYKQDYPHRRWATRQSHYSDP